MPWFDKHPQIATAFMVVGAFSPVLPNLVKDVIALVVMMGM